MPNKPDVKTAVENWSRMRAPDQVHGGGYTSTEGQTVHIPGEYQAKLNWQQPSNPELVALSGNETSFGSVWGHEKHSGGPLETAYGPLGLKPSTGLEHFVSNPELQSYYPDIVRSSQGKAAKKADPQVQQAFVQAFQNDPTLYNQVAEKEWQRLLKKFDGNVEHAALGWRWGEAGAKKQIKEGLSEESQKYVDLFKKNLAATKTKVALNGRGR